ncbi:hypothetical protein MRB53_042303 [Persea americana]|nr:hypothetical protein MRB53_042303 [Persea americana]
MPSRKSYIISLSDLCASSIVKMGRWHQQASKHSSLYAANLQVDQALSLCIAQASSQRSCISATPHANAQSLNTSVCKWTSHFSILTSFSTLFMFNTAIMSSVAELAARFQMLQHSDYERSKLVKSTSPFVLVLIDGDSALVQKEDIKQHNILFLKSIGMSEKSATSIMEESLSISSAITLDWSRLMPKLVSLQTDKSFEDLYQDSIENYLLLLISTLELIKMLLITKSKAMSIISANIRMKNESRLTLIESIAFPWPLRELAARFSTTKFPDIFRQDKIVVTVKRDPSPLTPPTPISWAHAASERSSENSDPGWSIVGKKAVVKKQKELWVNRYGQRIDLPLEPWDQTTEKYLEDRAICQKYVLGTCDNKKSCKFKHDDTLTAAEKLTLARIARKSKCMSGLLCMDVNCPFGHQCYYGKECLFGSKCRFDEEDMHNFDKVKKTRIQ